MSAGAVHGPQFRRGDVWYLVDDPCKPSVGTEIWSERPALIVSSAPVNDQGPRVQVVCLSTQFNRGLPVSPAHVFVGQPTPARADSVAICDQINSVDKSRLIRKLGRVEDRYLDDVTAAMQLVLDVNLNHSHALFKRWESQIKHHGIDVMRGVAALEAANTTERTKRLEAALKAMAAERDAYYQLSESRPALMSALEALEAQS